MSRLPMNSFACLNWQNRTFPWDHVTFCLNCFRKCLMTALLLRLYHVAEMSMLYLMVLDPSLLNSSIMKFLYRGDICYYFNWNKCYLKHNKWTYLFSSKKERLDYYKICHVFLERRVFICFYRCKMTNNEKYLLKWEFLANLLSDGPI